MLVKVYIDIRRKSVIPKKIILVKLFACLGVGKICKKMILKFINLYHSIVKEKQL